MGHYYSGAWITDGDTCYVKTQFWLLLFLTIISCPKILMVQKMVPSHPRDKFCLRPFSTPSEREPNEVPRCFSSCETKRVMTTSISLKAIHASWGLFCLIRICGRYKKLYGHGKDRGRIGLPLSLLQMCKLLAHWLNSDCRQIWLAPWNIS